MTTSSPWEERLVTWLTAAAAGLFRVLGGVALLSVLFLPAYKGLWIGYVPVVVGAAALALLLSGRMGVRAGMDRLSVALSAMGEARFVAFLLVVPAVVQILLILLFQSQPVSDARYVFDQALAFVRSGQMSPNTRYAPGSIWWYALWIRTFGPSPLIAQLSLVPLAAGKCLAVYGLARLTVGRETGRWVAVVAALFPSTLVYVSGMYYYAYVYAFLVAAMWYFWVRSLTATRWVGPSLAAGLCGGLAALSLPIMLISSLQTLTVFLLAGRRIARPSTWGRWALFMVTFVAVLSPWVARNYRIFGEFVPVCTAGGYVFYSANNPESNGLYSPAAEEAAVEVSTPAEYLAVSRTFSAKAKAFIKEHPRSFLRLVLLKNLHTWGTDTTFLEVINWRGRSNVRMDRILSAILQSAYVLLVFAWVRRLYLGLRQGEEASLPLIIAAVVVGSLWVVFSVFEGGARHHLPFIPLIILYTLSVVPGSRTAAPDGKRLT